MDRPANEPARPGVPRAFVLGHPAAQSRSPLLHGHWLRTMGLPGAYDRQDVPPDALAGFFTGLRARGYVGGNVTAPHKLAVMAHVARLDATAQAIGAVNTIWDEPGGWVGGNTDAAGFLANLDEGAPGWDRPGGTAIVLGAGGAARAVCYGLLSRGLAVHVVNRTLSQAEAIAARFGAGVHPHGLDALPGLLAWAGLLVNATALGMVGKPALTVDLTGLPRDAVVHDLVYAPLRTPLLQDAAARGHRTVDGLGMLLHQAVPGFAHWFGQMPRVTPALRALVEDDLRESTPT